MAIPIMTSSSGGGGNCKSTDHATESEALAAQVQTASDPKAVDDLLTQELMKLSVQDRNDIQEEIHGVKCLAVEETPALVETALAELAHQLDVVVPDEQKQAYLQSLRPPKESELPEHQQILQQLHQLEPLHKTSYVHEPDFRLRFLRCESFDIVKTAKRILLFLEVALELFGDCALRRPLRLSDFTKDELRYLRKGRFQVLPHRDRSGRRIATIFPEPEEDPCPPTIKAKITLYQSWAIGYRDVETQRKGHVIVVWFDHTSPARRNAETLRYRWDASKSTRVSAIHVCSPDTPLFRMRRSLAVMRCGDENRSKLRIHLGESVELQYALQGYGIPSEDIPISWTGKIKIKNLVHWMRIRHAIENYDEFYSEDQAYSSSSTSTPSASSPLPWIVECPQPQDILFRKGNSYSSHIGNAKLRAMIHRHLNDNDRNKNKKDTTANTKTTTTNIKRPKQLAMDIFEECQKLQRTATTENRETPEAFELPTSHSIGRYLIWDNQNDWWAETTDREQICLKIEYMIRELRKSMSKSPFVRKSQKRGTSQHQRSNDRSSGSNGGTAGRGTPPLPTAETTIKLQSGTTLFRSQDGRTDDVFGGRFRKRQKKQGALELHRHCHPHQQHHSCSSEEDNSDYKHDDGCWSNDPTTECFGMKFSPCSM